MDATTKLLYAELKRLQAILDTASIHGDAATVIRLEEQINAIVKQIRARSTQ
jgi:hypothetical protein